MLAGLSHFFLPRSWSSASCRYSDDHSRSGDRSVAVMVACLELAEVVL